MIGTSALRAVASLLRLPLLPTAWADVLAGAFLSDPAAVPAEIAPALGVSSGLYLFGMALNGIVDRRRDDLLYPNRPLPARRLTLRQAWCAAAAMLGLAAACVWFLPAPARIVAAGLALLVVAYDAAVKDIPVAGPLAMGSCRAANLLLGAAAAGDAWSGAALPAAALLGIYVAGVSFLSSLEGADVSPSRLRACVATLFSVPLAMAPFARGWTFVPVAGLALLVASCWPREGARAGRPDERLVHRLLGGIYLIDGFLLGYAGAAALCAAATAAGLVPLLVRAASRRPGEPSSGPPSSEGPSSQAPSSAARPA